jgi:hypothetical protein
MAVQTGTTLGLLGRVVCPAPGYTPGKTLILPRKNQARGSTTAEKDEEKGRNGDGMHYDLCGT